jgi:membrane protein
MGDLVKRIMAHPFVAHLMRAIARFNERLGTQFAAAITYFSVLAMVPVLMFAFAMVGMTLTVLRPDLLDVVGEQITQRLGDAESTKEIVAVIKDALDKWQAVGLVAIASAAYAGAGWIGNLRRAVDAMWRPVFAIVPEGSGVLGIVLDTVKNLGILIGLVLVGGLSVAASSLTSGVLGAVLTAVGIATLNSVVTVLIGVILSLLTGWLLFVYLYTVLPTERRPFREVAQGAVFGGLGLAILQYFAGLLTRVFANNPASALFGPIIVVILALNIFATIVMLGAAWTSTADDAAITRPAAVDPGEPDAVLLGPAEMADLHPVTVPQAVAERGVKVGMGLGYLTGAATGLGIGAVVGRLLAGWVHWRRRRR